MKNNPSEIKENTYPVSMISWDNAQEFIRRLNVATGKNYRLPTEAEWEYAARGGVKSKGHKYSGSDNVSEVAWLDVNSNINGKKSLHSVGTKKPNELGIYDLNGNVWEWCNDWYSEYPASSPLNTNSPSPELYRIIRGGGYYSEAKQCRISFRSNSSPSNHFIGFGFRLLLSSQ